MHLKFKVTYINVIKSIIKQVGNKLSENQYDLVILGGGTGYVAAIRASQWVIK